jgi:hypothetical protein
MNHNSAARCVHLPVRDARTAAYGSAYCIVRLTRGAFGSPADGGANELDTPPNPEGAGSENAPYASRDGREMAAGGVAYPLLRTAPLENVVLLGPVVVVVAADQRLESSNGELALDSSYVDRGGAAAAGGGVVVDLLV